MPCTAQVIPLPLLSWSPFSKMGWQTLSRYFCNLCGVSWQNVAVLTRMMNDLFFISYFFGVGGYWNCKVETRLHFQAFPCSVKSWSIIYVHIYAFIYISIYTRFCLTFSDNCSSTETVTLIKNIVSTTRLTMKLWILAITGNSLQ